MDRGPQDYSLFTYTITLAVALLGGVVNWIGGVRTGKYAVVQVQSLIGEMFTAAFAGLLCFWLCEAAGTNQLLTIALVGITGHMGSRAITLFEGFAAKKFNVELPSVSPPAAPPPVEPPKG